MVYSGKSQSKMEDDWGYPHVWNPPCTIGDLDSALTMAHLAKFTLVYPHDPQVWREVLRPAVTFVG